MYTIGGAMKYINNISEIIISSVDIEDIISEYVDLKRAGSNLKGLCPFHNEKTPSFVVSKDKQLYHCFGCGESGNVISFVMKKKNMDFLDAIEYLAEIGRVDLNDYLDKSSNYKENYIPREQKKNLHDLMKYAARFYYHNLSNNENAKKYLYDRAIDEITIKKFGLGYARDSWDDILKYLTSGKFTEKQILDAGLIIKKEKNNGYYDRFRDRIIFPIIDVQNKVIGFGGRIIGNGMPKYLNSPETVLFNKSNTLYNLNLAKNELKEEKTLIIVEGYMDVISLYSKGIKNVVATLGTALTKSHGRLLKRYADTVIISYDSDQAGIKATERSVEILKDTGLTIKILTLTDGLDPDEYIKKYGVDVFRTKIKKAKTYVDYKLHLLKEKYALEYETDRQKFYMEAKELLAIMPANAIREKYIEDISKWTYMSLESIRMDLKNTSNTSSQVVNKKVKLNKLTMIETRLLYLSLMSKKNYNKIFGYIEFDDIKNNYVKKALKFLLGYYSVNDQFDITKCIDHLDLNTMKYIKLVLEKSIQSTSEKEVDTTIFYFKQEVIQRNITIIINHIAKINQSDELSDEEKKEKLDVLNKLLMENKERQKNIINHMQ